MAQGGRHSTYHRRSYLVKKAQARTRKRRIVIAVTFALILSATIAIGFFAYNKIVNDKLSNSGSNATSVLTKQADNGAAYTLVKVDSGKDASVSASRDTLENTELYFLMRTDASNACVSFLVFPTNLSVKLSDKKTHPLWQATNFGGDAELINVINDFCDVNINHIIETDAESLGSLVENVGGIQMTLSSELNDPYAGTLTLHSGDVTLDSRSTCTLLRTRNVLGSYDTISKNVSAFASALMSKMTSSGGFELANVIEQFANSATSDMKVQDFTDFATKISGKGVTVYNTTIPGSVSKSTDTSETIYVARESESETVIENFKAGDDARDVAAKVKDFDRSNVHVEVRNGAQITGAAATCRTFLEGKGYVVDSVGNTDDGATYDETLIVYLGSEYENPANAIVNELGCGRVVNGGDYYSSSSNIIVIIGQDWTSTS